MIQRIWIPLMAVLVASLTSAAVDLGVAVGRGWSPPAVYVATCVALMLAAGGVVGGLLGWSGRAEIAVAGWAALNVPFGVYIYGPKSWAFGLAVGFVVWASLLPNDRLRESPLSPGIAVGLAVSLCAVVLPRIFLFLGIARPKGAYYALPLLVTMGAILLAHSLYARFGRRVRWLPSENLVSLLVLFAFTLYVPQLIPDTGAQKEIRLTDASESRSASPPDASLPSVIVLVLDTVRADHLSVYGYERDTTPFLKRFVAESDRSVVYPLAFSPASWTLPGHASLFTGSLPSSHGAHTGRLRDRRRPLSASQRLEAETTLAEAMKAHGYRTAAVLANSQVAFYNGMMRGFDQVVVPPHSGKLALLGESLRAQFAPLWFTLVDLCDDDPWFVLGNYMETHWPYAPSPPYRGVFTGPRSAASDLDRYDEELLALDDALRSLLGELDRRGVLDRSWLVITADHGEAFAEHGQSAHGTSIYNEQVRIPMIVQPPRGEQVVSHPGPVSLIDIPSTLTAAVGARPVGVGRDLRAPVETAPVQIEFYGSLYVPPDLRKRWRAVVLGQSKLIERDESVELYRLDTDPTESVNLSQERPTETRALARLLPTLDSGDEDIEVGEGEIPVEELQLLRELGYVE
jgi:arylsulfatase A-like enzyme